jgi:two-component system, response regulator RegA
MVQAGSWKVDGMNDERQRQSGSILFVDDDNVFRERMARALRARGYAVVTASNYDKAMEELADGRRFGSAVVDLRMPGRSGLELVAAMREIDAAERIVVLTGYGSITSSVEAMRLGAFNYLAKPVDADDLLRILTEEERPVDPRDGAGGFTPPTLARAEWEHIQRVLADCGGNKSVTARQLGITRRTLQLKLKKFAPST